MHYTSRDILGLVFTKPELYPRRLPRVVSSNDVIQKDSSSSLSDGQIQKVLQLLSEKNITFEELVAQRKLTTTTLGTTTTTSDDRNSTTTAVSWGLILPIVLVGVFLISVAVCLYWNTWRDKRRLQTEAAVPNLSLSTFSRNTSGGDDWKTDLRSSIRSTTPLRSGSRDASTLHPMAYHNSLSDSMSTSRSSYSTNAGTSFSRDDHERHMHTRRKLSPIDEVGPYVSKFGGSNVASVSQYEGCMASQGVYSPYHLTWVSPQTVSVNMRPEDINNNNRAMVETSFYRSAKSSPFFPNNNTPTTDCGRPESSPPSSDLTAHRNHGPMCYNNMAAVRYPSSSSDTSYTDASGGTAIGAVSSLDYPGSMCDYGTRKCPSETGSRDDSDSSSLPSSINPFRLRHTTRLPEHRHTLPSYTGPVTHTTFTEPLASSIDSYTSSDNTSLYPNVGSSVNTTSHPLSMPSNPRSLPQSGTTTPASSGRRDDVFDTAIALVDGAPKACLVNGDTSSLVSLGSSNTAAALFRSWSASTELNHTVPLPAHSVASPMSAPPGGIPFNPRSPKDVTPNALRPESRVVIGGASHNNLDKSQSNSRHVVFQNIPPVLEDRKYWL